MRTLPSLFCLALFLAQACLYETPGGEIQKQFASHGYAIARQQRHGKLWRLALRVVSSPAIMLEDWFIERSKSHAEQQRCDCRVSGLLDTIWECRQVVTRDELVASLVAIEP
jgi:hypothetical protein